MEKMSFEIYRYNPDVDAKPYMHVTSWNWNQPTLSFWTL